MKFNGNDWNDRLLESVQLTESTDSISQKRDQLTKKAESLTLQIANASDSSKLGLQKSLAKIKAQIEKLKGDSLDAGEKEHKKAEKEDEMTEKVNSAEMGKFIKGMQIKDKTVESSIVSAVNADLKKGGAKDVDADDPLEMAQYIDGIVKKNKIKVK